MGLEAAITLGVTVLLAVAGLIVTYVTNLRLARRKDRLDRVSRQLAEFYGPLFALMEASDRLWGEMWPRQSFAPGTPRPTPSQMATWRRWMTHVYMPLNRRMAEIVITRADLLVEDHLPKCLEDLCAHVIGYEAVLAHWQEDGFDSADWKDHISLIDFPRNGLWPYVQHSFTTLKREQARLLAQVQRT
ncbi:hypothetical protein [Spongiactinospora sp. TRM90649]|uniref:hypothetical protein n=1 Tax=Spongiactinospora sp. TRM90649 TaxID=3031114 RepID=UPI0023F804CF|nr:hypothetical protein [Spongiactinospora sp. TRM90649]MDF5758096.1 hypothetical protein [Spongiactinospora sp. TRM90649]